MVILGQHPDYSAEDQWAEGCCCRMVCQRMSSTGSGMKSAAEERAKKHRGSELIGDDPEAAEAALAQAIPGRTRLGMCSPVGSCGGSVCWWNIYRQVTRCGGREWRLGAKYLLHSVESRLRDLLTLTFNIHRKEDVSPKEVEYLPLPDTPEDEEQKRAQAEYDEIMRRQLEEL